MARDAEAFPDDGLSLKDFARRECNPAWEALAKAEKEVASACGRPARQLASAGPADVGWLEPRYSQRSRLIEIADEAERTLWNAVRDRIKSGRFIIRGIPKGQYQTLDVSPALLGKVRIVSLSKSHITTEGRRRFECVRVFQAMDKSKEPAIPSVGSEFPAAPVVAYTIANPGAVAAALLSMDDLTVGERAVHCAINELWGGKIPTLLKANERDKKIMDYLKSRPDLSRVGPSTIKRYLRKYHEAAKHRQAKPRPG